MIKNVSYIVRKPWDEVAEGWCKFCVGFTTNYNHLGVCREHGVKVSVRADEMCPYCRKPDQYCDCP